MKFDSYVFETNVHYPTDLNLLWDASRKCIELLSQIYETNAIKGWRKKKYWKRLLKKVTRDCAKVSKGGGANKEERLAESAQTCLATAFELEEKVNQSITQLKEEAELGILDLIKLSEVETFQYYLIMHIDLVERRLIKKETIPHQEKVFSLFEEHTELIKKGKVRPPVEFGHRLLIATDQYGLILDYKIMDGGSECAETMPLADRLLNRFGEDAIRSISSDKGFSSEENRELLNLYIPEVILPKKGRLNQQDKERQRDRKWRARKDAHSAVESNINCLEHHGLDRCPDKGYQGYKRYTGLGILAYNLHKIGARLIEEERNREWNLTKPKRAKAAT